MTAEQTKTLLAAWDERFGGQPEALVRAPGRVNLIGEHTDYNGFPVLPIAIDKSIRVEFTERSDGLIIARNSATEFKSFSFDYSKEIKPFKKGDWGNYVKAAIWGLKEALELKPCKLKGFDATFRGNIPIAAGLSSSSALVVASALTFLSVNNIDLQALELAEILSKAEKFVGTEGGGMDQAVSLMALKDHALKIDFFPLRTTAISIPSDFVFVVCNSMIRAPKTESARHFNALSPILWP